MLLDTYLGRYDYASAHHLDVAASPERVFDAVLNMDLSDSRVVRWLCRLRGLPYSLDLEGMRRMGFIRLAEVPPREIVFGLIGRFWKIDGDLQRLDPAGFLSFDRPGYAKAAWSFSLDPLSDSSTRMRTETRILCLDEASRKRFRLYWTVIRPFSGWIRVEALRSIRRQVESLGAGSSERRAVSGEQ